jgi:BlaI family transcriptional regulator, penicillinase repressor
MTKSRNMQLSKTEEQIMELIWNKEKVFLKDLIDCFPDPKPASTTVATLLKRMQDKGFVGYTLFGNSRQYYPLVKKSDYFSKHVNGIIKNYFGNSALQFASFFTTTSNLTTSELEDLKKIIDKEIKRKKK